MNLKNLCINLKNPSSPRSEKSILYSRMQLRKRWGGGPVGLRNVHRLPKSKPENSCHIKRNGKIIILFVIPPYPQLIYKFQFYSQKKKSSCILHVSYFRELKCCDVSSYIKKGKFQLLRITHITLCTPHKSKNVLSKHLQFSI